MYKLIFSNTPASTTEPSVDASTCASGSHPWNGTSGTFTNIAAPKANYPRNCNAGVVAKAMDVKSNVPAISYVSTRYTSIMLPATNVYS